jgi:hypothetical protein
MLISLPRHGNPRVSSFAMRISYPVSDLRRTAKFDDLVNSPIRCHREERNNEKNASQALEEFPSSAIGSIGDFALNSFARL